MVNFVEGQTKSAIARVLSKVVTFVGVFWKFNRLSKKHTRRIPILLLPGWFSTGDPFFLLKMRLEGLGYKVFLPSFAMQTEHIAKQALKLQKYVRENNIKDMIFIGHSQGAVVGMYSYGKYKLPIKLFIGIAAPFKGTPQSQKALFFPVRKDLNPKSAIIREIQSSDKPAKCYNIIAKKDERVPIEYTELEGVTRIIVDVHGHVTLIFSRKVFAVIKKILSSYEDL